MKKQSKQRGKKDTDKMPVRQRNDRNSVIPDNQRSVDPGSTRAARTERSGAGQQQNNSGNPIVS